MASKTPFSYQGSKLRELNELSKYLPKNSNIIEPFVGTGIVSATFGSDKCIVNDYSPDIYSIWKYAKEGNEIFYSLIREYMKEENRVQSYYYEKREFFNKKFWKSKSFTPEKAALFFYIINTAYGGMLRFGPNGFNSPYKLFLDHGREYRVEEKLNLLNEFACKFDKIYNLNAIDFLKYLELKLNSSYIIYCDPPYVNSASTYINAWNNDNLLELDDYLDYLAKTKNIYSVMSNYNSDLKFKGNIVNKFEKTRLAQSKVTISDNIILTYGSLPPMGIELFYE